MDKTAQKDSPLTYLKVFLLIVGVIVLLSVIYKTILLYKESTFKSYSYTILVLSNDAHIIQVDKNKNSLSILHLKNGEKKLKGKSKVTQSILTTIPIDGSIEYKNPKNFNNFRNEFFSLQNSINVGTNPFFYSLKDITIIDLLSVQTLTTAIPSENILEETVEEMPDTWDATVEKKVFRMFKDPILINDNISVEVLNAAVENGLGGRIGKMLEHVGINVVSIHSIDAKNDSQIFYHDKETDTLKHLVRIFPVLPKKIEEPSIADITVVIGKDIGKNLSEDL